MIHGHMNVKFVSAVIAAEGRAKDKGGRNSVVRSFHMSMYGVREDFVLTLKRADHRCFLHNFIPISKPSPSGHLLQCFLTDSPKKIFVLNFPYPPLQALQESSNQSIL